MEKGSGTGEQGNTFTIFYLMCMTELYVAEVYSNAGDTGPLPCNVAMILHCMVQYFILSTSEAMRLDMLCQMCIFCTCC